MEKEKEGKKIRRNEGTKERRKANFVSQRKERNCN